MVMILRSQQVVFCKLGLLCSEFLISPTSIVRYWSGCKLILLVGRMVDFLVKKSHVFVTVLKHRQHRRHVDARWIADGTSAKHGEKYGGVI